MNIIDVRATTKAKVPTTIPAIAPPDSPDDLAVGGGVAVAVAEEYVLVKSV